MKRIRYEAQGVEEIALPRAVRTHEEDQIPETEITGIDALVVAAAVHWFESKAIGEIGRVVKPSAWVVVYEVRFRGEMLGAGAFAGWMRDECGPRYGSVSKNELSPEKVASIGFGLGWEEELRFDVPMSLEALVAYLMTHSERIAAVREGRETEAQQEEYLTEALRPFFAAVERRQVGFSIRVEAFAR